MSKLIQQMLDFARMENGSEKYRKERLNFSELAAGVCEDMALIREKGIQLSSRIEKEIFLCGNALLLSRMLANLIGNAYRYGRENGQIQVTLRKTENGILLSVEDNGIGVRKEEQEKSSGAFISRTLPEPATAWDWDFPWPGKLRGITAERLRSRVSLEKEAFFTSHFNPLMFL